jgi:hypothetical protein
MPGTIYQLSYAYQSLYLFLKGVLKQSIFEIS